MYRIRSGCVYNEEQVGMNVDEGEDGGLVGLYTENGDGVFNLLP